MNKRKGKEKGGNNICLLFIRELLTFLLRYSSRLREPSVEHIR